MCVSYRSSQISLFAVQVQKDYPHLVAGTSIARKMGFPDVILPGGKFPSSFISFI